METTILHKGKEKHICQLRNLGNPVPITQRQTRPFRITLQPAKTSAQSLISSNTSRNNFLKKKLS